MRKINNWLTWIPLRQYYILSLFPRKNYPRAFPVPRKNYPKLQDLQPTSEGNILKAIPEKILKQEDAKWTLLTNFSNGSFRGVLPEKNYHWRKFDKLRLQQSYRHEMKICNSEFNQHVWDHIYSSFWNAPSDSRLGLTCTYLLLVTQLWLHLVFGATGRKQKCKTKKENRNVLKMIKIVKRFILIIPNVKTNLWCFLWTSCDMNGTQNSGTINNATFF